MQVTMLSFSVESGSRGYHVYRETIWRDIHLHQHVVVLKEVNNISIDIDPYCCRIAIKRVDRIGSVAVAHVPRELCRSIFYFIQEGGSVTGTVASTTPRISPIPEGGLGVLILMHFTHENKAISSKMETLVRKQVEKMKKTFDVETLAGENFSENCPEENPTCAEEDEEKEEKEQAEEDFTIEVKSDGEQKSVIVIDLYVR